MKGLLGRLHAKLQEQFGGPHQEQFYEEPDSTQVTPSPFDMPDTTKNIDKLINPEASQRDALLKAIMRFGPTGSMKDWS